MKFENLVQFEEEVKALDKPFEAEVFAQTHEKVHEAHKFKAIMSKRYGQVLSIVSQRYSIVQSQDVLNSVISALSKLGIHEVSGSLIEQKGRTYARILLPQYITEGDNDRAIQVGFLLVNSYDATKSLTLKAYAGRLVCTNGMILGETLGGSMIRKHVGNINYEVEEAVKSLIAQIVERSPYLTTLIQKAIESTYEDFEAMELELKELGFAKNLSEKILSRIEYSSSKHSKWDLYNAITNFYSRKKISESGRIKNLERAEQLLVAPAL